MIDPRDWIYDVETYKCIFSAGFIHAETGKELHYEVSDRVDQSQELSEFLRSLEYYGHRLVGFNNEHFDWPVVDYVWRMISGGEQFTSAHAYEKASSIINSPRGDWSHSIPPWKRRIKQIDLFKIHHFDNKARSVSLKKLEIAMGSDKVIDLPYDPASDLNDEQRDNLIHYMMHDCRETLKFYNYSLDQIAFREELSKEYPSMGDVINFNDTKIGKKLFEQELESAGTSCYVKVDGRKKPRQTERSTINIGDLISPKVVFTNDSFERVKQWLSSQVISGYYTNGFLKSGDEATCEVNGFQYHFGQGGIHGSVSRKSVTSDDDWQIWDWDVASYYPNIAITHGMFPEHLSFTFVDSYSALFERRKQYAKGTPQNAAYKLALNGVYGASNDAYSCFYDPQYTMSVTINGQLLLCVLAEWLLFAPDGDSQTNLDEYIQMLQINTDGLTVKIHRSLVPRMHEVCKLWEDWTGLTLESQQYTSMHIRDVNNYIAVKTDGSIKRLGAYAYITAKDDPNTREITWYKDHSKLIVPRAAEAHMVHGKDIADFIMSCRDPELFQCSVKVPRNAKLKHGENLIQNVSRYYVSTRGDYLTKIMKPLAGKKEDREFSVEKGWRVKITNDMSQFDWNDVNWLYYIEQARKLILS
jgi:hypothetical protein